MKSDIKIGDWVIISKAKLGDTVGIVKSIIPRGADHMGRCQDYAMVEVTHGNSAWYPVRDLVKYEARPWEKS